MRPVRNCMIINSSAPLLKDEFKAILQLRNRKKIGCKLCWIMFENPRSIIVKNFFQWKPRSLQSLSHPLAGECGGSAVSRPPYFLETHVLVQITGDIKIFLESLKKLRPTLFFFLTSLSWFWWEFTWLKWQNCNMFFFQENCRVRKGCWFT